MSNFSSDHIFCFLFLVFPLFFLMICQEKDLESNFKRWKNGLLPRHELQQLQLNSGFLIYIKITNHEPFLVWNPQTHV